jgi:hypothetical protein
VRSRGRREDSSVAEATEEWALRGPLMLSQKRVLTAHGVQKIHPATCDKTIYLFLLFSWLVSLLAFLP